MVQTVRNLAELKLEAVKRELLRATSDEVAKLQGEAAAWLDLIDMIDREPALVDTPVKSAV